MRPLFVTVLLSVFLAPGQEAALPYFSEVRDVTISAADKQNYIVVDDKIWSKSRPDLADLRLVDEGWFLPFALKEERAAAVREEQNVRLFNLGTNRGRTEFDLDLSSVSEYDHIRLQLAAKNFVASAIVEGRNDLATGRKTKLRSSTLYDFSRENLGSNFTLQLPTSSFRFLHVMLSSPLRVGDVKGASVSNHQAKSAVWTKVGSCRREGERERTTVFACELPQGVPVDRISFSVAPSQPNFRRDVSVYDAERSRITGSEISRVRLNHNGTEVSSQNLAIDLAEARTRSLSIEIRNNDDQPLRISTVELLSIEHRVYFDPQGRAALKLYYGDPKSPAPVFDYAKLFMEDPSGVEARLGPAAPNPMYTGRPDDRPWSERHQALLWAAMIAAVAVLALLAVRGLKSDGSAHTS